MLFVLFILIIFIILILLYEYHNFIMPFLLDTLIYIYIIADISLCILVPIFTIFLLYVLFYKI